MLQTDALESVSIKPATDTDSDHAVAIAVLAFSTDPLMRWSLADPHRYLTYYPAFVRAIAGKAFEHRTAYYVDGFSGIALWLPPGVTFDEHAVVDAIQRAVPESLQEEAFGVLKQTGTYHPSQPHWYLPLIGVDPRHQRQGFGSALMKHALVACDRDRTLAYLESSNPENLAFYERHGFESLGTIQVGTAPPIFPMLREPR
jgi:ribosomal protein S18 acetylase RimI-like enzyme